MFLPARGLVRFSFGVTLAAYTAGILLAGTVTTLGLHRVITTVMSELTPSENPKRAVATAPQRSIKIASISRQLSALPSGREASMTPLHTAGFVDLPKSAGSRQRLVEPAIFGSSSRYSARSSRRGRDDDDDEDRDERPQQQEAGTYRTLCVRLCDGYYFPISFSATRDRFARDARTCESSCGGQARLFVYRNPGADVEDMVDLQGQPYKKLSTAFLYRTEYVAACRCKPNPWDAEALERHRLYALTAAKRKGNKQAAAELDALATKMKRDRTTQKTPVFVPAGGPPAPAETAAAQVSAPKRQPDRTLDKTGRMALGARTQREQPARKPGRTGDWMSQALGRSFAF